MFTWLMGAWLFYHFVAVSYYYFGTETSTPAALENYLNHSLYVVDIGQYLGAAGPVFIITYGGITMLMILITLYLEMGRTARYAINRDFKGSQYDLYGSIFLLVVCSVELFFVPIAATSIFVILLFACVMDVLTHVRFLHHFIGRGR
ncbi:MAG: hypothetical protein P8Y67_05045 [Alphaproteobacteria bacterium]